MEKINIAELLKDCPKGMKLDCILVSNPVRYNGLDDGVYLIDICTEYVTRFYLTKEGYLYNLPDSKCVIFPKGKTTWEGFVPPCEFKDGDILATDLGSVFYLNTRLNTGEYYGCYVGIGGDGSFHICEPFAYKECCGFATKEERTRLFDAIKENGYEWNEKTKTLKKLVKPNFKVSDWVVNKFGDVWHIDSFNSEIYHVSNGDKYCYFLIEEQDKMHLWTIQDAKDGDVLVDKDNNIGIFQKFEGIYWYSYIYLGCDGELRGFSIGGSHKQTDVHPATKEQRDLLFQKIKEAGYKWNSETKTLEKLIKPIFKAGDKVRRKNNHNLVFTITSIEEDSYGCGANLALWFDDQDKYELIPNKFDITTLKPFDNCKYSLDGGITWKYAQYWFIQEKYNTNDISIELWQG